MEMISEYNMKLKFLMPILFLLVQRLSIVRKMYFMVEDLFIIKTRNKELA